MKITSLWIVQNAESYSTLGDICHQEPAETLHQWILGATSLSLGLAVGRELGVAYYTEQEEALTDAVVRLGRQAGIDAADDDYRAGTRGEIDEPNAEPCAARGDDGLCEPGNAEDPGLCRFCGNEVDLEDPTEGALELPEDLAPNHRASAVRAFVREYNEQMRTLVASEEE